MPISTTLICIGTDRLANNNTSQPNLHPLDNLEKNIFFTPGARRLAVQQQVDRSRVADYLRIRSLVVFVKMVDFGALFANVKSKLNDGINLYFFYGYIPTLVAVGRLR